MTRPLKVLDSCPAWAAFCPSYLAQRPARPVCCPSHLAPLALLGLCLPAGPPLATAPALVRFLVEDPMVLSQATGDLVRPQQGGAAPANALSAGVSAGALGLGASLGRLQHWLQGPAALLQSPAAPLDSGVGFGPGAAPTTAKQKDVDLDAPVGAWGPGMANGVGAAQPGHDTSAPLPGTMAPSHPGGVRGSPCQCFMLLSRYSAPEAVSLTLC